MTFARAFVLVFCLSLAGLQAATAGPILHALYCTEANSGPDRGLILSINHDLALKNTYARLSEQTVGGPRLVATYLSLQSHDSRPADGALIYRGRGFSITVPSSRPPVRPVSHMTAHLKGRDSRVIETDMYCVFPR